jgi:hypothetical protein
LEGHNNTVANMATFMTSAFTAPDRRKKAVTYGKSSRLATPAPAPGPAPNNDAPSPERPRKQTALLYGLERISTGESSNGTLSGIGRAANPSSDIFDVPSEDEFVANTAKTSKKLLTKRRVPEKDHNVPTPREGGPEQSRQSSQAPTVSRKAEPAKSAVKKPRRPVQPPKTAPTPNVPSGAPVAATFRRGKTPQPAQALQQESGNKSSAQRSALKPKAVSRATTPALAASKATKVSKGNAAFPIKKVSAKAAAGASVNKDVFDMPSSDDESHITTPKPSHQISKKPRNGPPKATSVFHENREEESTGSSDSAAARKRKRNGSVSSAAGPRPLPKQKVELSIPQHSRKYQKQENTSFTGLKSPRASAATVTVEARPILPVINKPKRTRVRTVPVLTRPLVTKGESSPAALHKMLPERTVLKPSPIADVSEAMEDDTFYEIPGPLATPVRPSSNDVSGSVTPRQKALFGSLLRSSSSTTPMPSISKLQLTDSKPRSLLGALSRSKSDVTHSVHSKQTRLIASLKDTDSSSEDDASDSEYASGSEGKLETHSNYQNTGNKAADYTTKAISTFDIASDEMDIDVDRAADSQTSQITSGFGNRSRFTYAKSRSYLQEENPDDAFLMSLDLDDPMMLGSQAKDSQTEDDEEASQARPKHELIRQGRNTEFQWTNAMFIDDLSAASSSSIRRSTLLELCTKMVDETFTHELLDSSLAPQFLTNVASNGDIIFNIAAAAATVFMLRANPTYTTLDQVYRSGLVDLLYKLLDNDIDIRKIAKNRKTNLSKIAQDSVLTFRSTILSASIWLPFEPETVSPQLVALKALESLVLGLREAKNVESIIDQNTLVQLLDIASTASEQCKNHNENKDAKLVLRFTFSTLEAVSLAKQKQLVWSARLLQSLASSMPVVFRLAEVSTITMAVKLCMNLTNNKPKACQQFSKPDFVQSLVQSIIERNKYLQGRLEEGQRTEVLDTLILSLGAMINLTEHSDEARLNVDDGDQLVETLVKTFVDGSARTAMVSYSHNSDETFSLNTIQAASMEESQSSVAVGYLSVLLGNMCLNGSVKVKVRAQLPGQQLTTLVDKIKEFVQVHEHANRKSRQFEGDEGQETWQNYTARILLVVKQLEQAEV